GGNSARGLLVKKHSENLQTHGDFSFPNSVKSWHEHLKGNEYSSNGDVTLLHCIGKNLNDLIEESVRWNLRVKSVKEAAGRVYLFLDRPLAITVGLSEALRNIVLISQLLEAKNTSVITDPLCEQTNCLTSLRVKYLSNVIKNLCTIYGKSPEVLVSSRSSCKGSETRVFVCESVLNAKSGSKETAISSEDFIRIRQDEMTLIAQHKYGVRVTTDSKWKEFLTHLGESAVAFELLQGRPSSTVKINFNNVSAGSSKGASFILYNCARLETIIRTFNDKEPRKHLLPVIYARIHMLTILNDTLKLCLKILNIKSVSQM
ncbi:DARL anticodon-binding domain-containing protein, partial [Operophtera brumata]